MLLASLASLDSLDSLECSLIRSANFCLAVVLC